MATTAIQSGARTSPARPEVRRLMYDMATPRDADAPTVRQPVRRPLRPRSELVSSSRMSRPPPEDDPGRRSGAYRCRMKARAVSRPPRCRPRCGTGRGRAGRRPGARPVQHERGRPAVGRLGHLLRGRRVGRSQEGPARHCLHGGDGCAGRTGASGRYLGRERLALPRPGPELLRGGVRVPACSDRGVVRHPGAGHHPRGLQPGEHQRRRGLQRSPLGPDARCCLAALCLCAYSTTARDRAPAAGRRLRRGRCCCGTHPGRARDARRARAQSRPWWSCRPRLPRRRCPTGPRWRPSRCAPSSGPDARLWWRCAAWWTCSGRTTRSREPVPGAAAVEALVERVKAASLSV